MENKAKKITYKGWKNCYGLSNKAVELVVTSDVGPRVIRYGFKGGTNEFRENEKHLGKKGGKEWINYGGHRLWHSPENMPRTYVPDNGPVKVEHHKQFTRFIQPVEKPTGIQKEIDIDLAPGTSSRVRLVHRLRNLGSWPVELAPWALSVMAAGGKAVIPLPPRGSHTDPANLLPKSVISVWSYTDLQDSRWTWGTRYIMLRQDVTKENPQMLGVLDKDGWLAYCNHGNLFIKTFGYEENRLYPDFDCNAEVYTSNVMLEVESLGPLVKLEPGNFVEHTEQWHLFRGVAMPRNDQDVDRNILPKVRSVL